MVGSVIPRALRLKPGFIPGLTARKHPKRTLCPRAQEGLVFTAVANDQEALLPALPDEIEN